MITAETEGARDGWSSAAGGRPRPAAAADVGWLSPAVGYAALALVLAVGVYAPILQNYFHTEDFDCLHIIANQGFWYWVLMPSAGHLLTVRNFVFAVMYAIAGGNPLPYFVLVLLVHAINTLLLFAIVRRLTCSARLAFVGATAWAVAPVNEGTLGWFSYSGHALIAVMLLVVLLRMIGRAEQPRQVGAGEALLWVALMLAAAQTQGYGLGPACAFPAVAALLLGVRRLSWRAWAVVLALPVGLVALYAWETAESSVRLTSTPEDTAVMLGHLLVFAVTTLGAGFGYAVSEYPSAGADAIAIVALAVTLVGFALGSGPARRTILTVTLLALTMYGGVAFGRATLYRNAMPDLPAYGASLTRYHYAGTAMLAIALCTALAQIGSRLRIAAPWSDVLMWAWLAGAVFFYARSDWAIDHFTAERNDAETAVRGIRDAVERTPVNQPVFIYNQGLNTAGAFPYFAGWADIYVIYFRRPLARPVYFIDQQTRLWRRMLGDTELTRVLYPLPEVLRRNVCPVQEPLTCWVR